MNQQYRRPSRRERMTDNRQRMSERRFHQLTRQPGFLRMPNKHDVRVQANALAIMMGNAGLTPEQAYARAHRDYYAGKNEGMVANPHKGKFSRNNDPAYRKGIWPAGKVAGAHNDCRAVGQ